MSRKVFVDKKKIFVEPTPQEYVAYTKHPGRGSARGTWQLLADAEGRPIMYRHEEGVPRSMTMDEHEDPRYEFNHVRRYLYRLVRTEPAEQEGGPVRAFFEFVSYKNVKLSKQGLYKRAKKRAHKQAIDHTPVNERNNRALNTYWKRRFGIAKAMVKVRLAKRQAEEQQRAKGQVSLEENMVQLLQEVHQPQDR